ncbi:hypothetical protein ABID20_000262 [Rhizobium alvei]
MAHRVFGNIRITFAVIVILTLATIAGLALRIAEAIGIW